MKYIKLFIIILIILNSFSIGYIIGDRKPEIHMNDLLNVGFTMFDPEGNQIERWDE